MILLIAPIARFSSRIRFLLAAVVSRGAGLAALLWAFASSLEATRLRRPLMQLVTGREGRTRGSSRRVARQAGFRRWSRSRRSRCRSST